MKKIIVTIITCLLFLVPVAAMATDWNGNGSDSIEACEDGQASYLHWVFTGGDGEDSVTLTVNSDTYQMEQKGKSGKGAWHATTSFYDPDNTTASTDADGGVLTISDGCTGEVVVQPTPTETKAPSESERPNESPRPSETESEASAKKESPESKVTTPDEASEESEAPVVTPPDTDDTVPPVTPTEEISERTELPHTGIEEWLLGIGTALMVLGGVSVDLTRRFV